MTVKSRRKQRREPASRAGRRLALAAIGLPLVVLVVVTVVQLTTWPGVAAGTAAADVPVPADWSLLPTGARQKASAAAAACMARPEDPAAYTELGHIYHGNAQPALAIAAYERAIELGADDAGTAYLLAVLEQDWGRIDAAEDHLETVVARDPTYAPAWYNLGRTRLEAGDPAGAVPAFQHAVSLDPI